MRFGRARKPVAKLPHALRRRQLHRRVRRRLEGTEARPRLSVFRSHKNIYAQIIDDASGQTLVSASTLDKQARAQIRYGGNVAAAKGLGKVLAERARQAGITRVVFDRGGYKYHGRVRALAAAAREGGLEF